jgi:hypothetical protein
MKYQITLQINDLEAGIRYCISQINSTSENWVKKEYQAVIEDYELQILHLKARLEFLTQAA